MIIDQLYYCDDIDARRVCYAGPSAYSALADILNNSALP